MCQEPGVLSNGQKVACRKCKLCLHNRVKDWAGRNIAESLESTRSFACDLTYGPELDENRMPIPGRSDHIRAAVLTYDDVKNFIRYVRTMGYKVRYFNTGEMGSLKGRAHWHIILHFTGKIPTHEVEVNFSDRHRNEFGKVYDHEICKAWPHGFMYWKHAAYEDVFYNCKYILKDDGDDKSQRKPGLSKKPPLGYRHFEKLAEQYVRQGIAPLDLLYRLPGIKKKKTGEPIEFLLAGRSAELYLEHFVRVWEETRPGQRMPPSDLVDNFIQYGKVVHDEWAMLEARDNNGSKPFQPAPTKQEIAAEKVYAADKKAERGKQRAAEDKEYWFKLWIKGARDGEERQRREQEFERWQGQQHNHVLEQIEQFFEEQHRKGLKFDGARWKWVKDPDRTEPCDCGVCRQLPQSGGNSAVSGGLSHRGDGEKPDYGQGPVGRKNALYNP